MIPYGILSASLDSIGPHHIRLAIGYFSTSHLYHQVWVHLRNCLSISEELGLREGNFQGRMIPLILGEPAI